MRRLDADQGFCCPQCKGGLDYDGARYHCPACLRGYPLRFGIPDFRLGEADLEDAGFFAAEAERRSFEELVRLYYRRKRHSEDLIERRVRGVLALAEKGAENLDEIAALSGGRLGPGAGAMLEVGCGAGGSLLAARERFARVVGIDIALDWLVMARRRFAELGLDIPLACAGAEHLPFGSGSFDLILAQDVLEHVSDQDATLREGARALKPGGVFFLSTPNRFSLTPEPHVRVWGVGFLPRGWMERYVRLVKGVPYKQIRLLSARDIRRLLARNGLPDHRVLLPPIPREEARYFSTLQKLEKACYDAGRRTPGLRALLYLIGPFFHILCYVDKDRDAGRSA